MPCCGNNWAKSSRREGDYAGAVAAAQRSLDQVPSSAQCWLLYGILLAQESKYEDAAAAFKRVLALDPQAVWARHNLASCLEKLGRRDEAVAEFKRALALKPDYGTAWLGLGQLYEEMGRTNDAEQCYNDGVDQSREPGGGSGRAGALLRQPPLVWTGRHQFCRRH